MILSANFTLTRQIDYRKFNYFLQKLTVLGKSRNLRNIIRKIKWEGTNFEKIVKINLNEN